MSHAHKCITLLFLASVLTLSAHAQSPSSADSPTPDQAKHFIDFAAQHLFDLGIKASRESWVEENFITQDTE